MKTIGVIREFKQPADLRTPLTPKDCVDIQLKFPGTKVIVQSSPYRCYPDEAYINAGIEVKDDVSEADILMGVKEVPYQELIKDKTYLFFSHTIKKQPHNRKMLREILKKNITLIDYETLVWEGGNRIIGFGRFAGIVGAHYSFLMWGLRNRIYHLKPAYQCKDMADMYAQYGELTLPPIKIVLCGDGRVAHGAMEFLKKLKIHHVTPEEFLEQQYNHPVYVQLRSEDYYERKDGKEWDKSDFYKHPQEYRSTFAPYYKQADIMINAVFWREGIEPFFTREEIKRDDFNIRVISDVTCDIPGPLPSTIRSTTIDQPFFGYHPLLEKEIIPFENAAALDVQAVGNLPCELPIDASTEFGDQLIRHVLPFLLMEDSEDIIEHATITANGRLKPRYAYLSDYIA
ncbi:MAG: NAD(P)-dependent oxidoreductase [Bacteroidia bacterium]|jgi:saccharopine dehydrogenase (NAD+, L-lysine forming)|nr:NAD(P)-dependent oxidoreductase [Bacteroidia bacterium]